MCNFNRISNLLIALEICFAVAVAAISVAVVFATVIILGAIMLAIAVLSLIATIVLARVIRGELNSCRSGPCGNFYFDPVIKQLDALTWMLVTFSVAFVVLLLAGPTPLMKWFMLIVAGIVSLQSTFLAASLSNFNSCEANAGGSRYVPKFTIAIIIGIVMVAAVIAVAAAGAAAGLLPAPSTLEVVRGLLG